ncbi:Replication factor A protein 2 [Mycoemilia scoparia]|uniref:Replication factor A protein 2 n=1 Tax=Mycoemilia scoparia TaxID=417184 RepID=A0A9W7ZZI6_9FUNG|nr:Replication factor A protein 2 [Mycoemilia scoparia]
MEDYSGHGQYGYDGGEDSRGGFMSSQSGDGTKKTHGMPSLRPVTIKQINSITQVHPDMPSSLDGEDVKQASYLGCNADSLVYITFVGVIRNVSVQNINITYTIEDGTGQIDVRVWSDKSEYEDSEAQQSIFEANQYVRIHGDIKLYNDKIYISGNNIRPVTDFNEITYHNLEALYVHLQKTRGPLGESGQAGQFNLSGSAYANPSFGAGVGGGLKPDQQKVYTFICENSGSKEGIHIDSILNALAGQVSSQQVRDALEWLTSEGHIYTALDDYHYKNIGA